VYVKNRFGESIRVSKAFLIKAKYWYNYPAWIRKLGSQRSTKCK
jgi:hypothetical protein